MHGIVFLFHKGGQSWLATLMVRDNKTNKVVESIVYEPALMTKEEFLTALTKDLGRLKCTTHETLDCEITNYKMFSRVDVN